MKKFLALLLLSPLLAISQTKNVVSVTRVFPKIDKVAQFEKALTAHAQKYHTGDWQWRVFEIQSGPDAGGFHITEGPVSWTQLDSRGDLGQAHTDDWNKNISPHLTDKYQSSYSVFREDLSTVQLNDFSDKVSVLHFQPKVGLGGKFVGEVPKFKKAWEAGRQTVAVYESINSGDAHIAFAFRMKEGLKEMESGFRSSMRDRYDQLYGAGAWDAYLENVNKYVDRIWSELLFLRKDLSSK